MRSLLVWLMFLGLALPVQALTPEEEFAQQCAQPGVVACRDFETETSLKRVGTLPSSELAETFPGEQRKDGSGFYQPELDCTLAATGKCSLRFNLSSVQRPDGSWYPSVVGLQSPAGHYDVTWDKPVADGETINASWYVRGSKGLYSPAYQPAHNKFAIFQGVHPRYTGGGTSFVLQRYPGSSPPGIASVLGFPYVYSYQSSTVQMMTDADAPTATQYNYVSIARRMALQQGDYTCVYGEWKDCAWVRPDVWAKVEWSITVGRLNQPESVIQAWVTFPGEPRRQFMRIERYTIINAPTSALGYGLTQLMLTPFTSDGITTNVADVYMWVDGLAIWRSGAASTPPATTPPVEVPPVVVTPPATPASKAPLVTAPPIPSTPGWSELAGTKVRPVCWNDTHPTDQNPGVQGCTGLTDVWCSGALDTKRNRMLLWCGGHAGYAGNELYAVNFAPFGVERLTDPGRPLNDQHEAIAGGTQPSARHTYDGIVYIPPTDQLFSSGGVATFLSGLRLDLPRSWLYDFGKKAWQLLPLSPTAPPPAMASGPNEQHSVAWDEVGQRVIIADVACLYSYAPATGQFARLTQTSATETCKYATLGVNPTVRHPGYYASIVDPQRRQLYVIGYGNAMRADLTATNVYPTAFTSKGGEAVIGNPWPGLAYDPVTGHIVGWVGGNTVYDLNPDTGVWTPYTFPGGPPATLSKDYTGVNKRFAYNPQCDCFVYVPSVDSNAFALRLPRGSVTPQTKVKGQLTFTHQHD